MITDARPLDPEFVPGDLRHRAGEVNTLTAALRPVTRGDHPNPCLLTGPSGTGKTCIARYTATQLREEVLDVAVGYVNCWEDYSAYAALYRLLDEITTTADIHRQSTPRDELLDRLRAYSDGPVVAILDEVDQLEDKRLLYDLYRTSGLTLILIANREEALFGELDDRVQSRLRTAEHIRFSQYSLDELVGILRDRAEWSLRDGAITDRELHHIADAAAGDARVAITTLREAARYAQQNGADQITQAAVGEAVPDAKAEIRQKSVDRLTPHQQVVYEIVMEAGEISPSDLYAKYRERVDDPKSDRTVRNYLTKLERYNLIQAVGENRGRTYEFIE
jgi:orc1/cdc6 family replication initiation protein